MDVPFSESGAMSRAHYALVRKMESATPQVADQILLAEVQSIRHQLTRSALTLRQCKESLTILLYCSMSVNPGTHVDVQFALPHAINLAEAGQTVQDKRMGYLFCAEVMSPEHELQLMLVNSIRKDLDSPGIPRICLALDTLIQSPSKDVIPAVQSRLHDLLSHNSVHVRRRALLAIRKLSEQEPGILGDVASKTRKRLSDLEPDVVIPALDLCETLLQSGALSGDKFCNVLSTMLDQTWSLRPSPSHSRLLGRLVQAVSKATPSVHNVQTFLEIVRHYIQRGPTAYAIVYQCFSAVSTCPVETLQEAQSSVGTFFIQEIRGLLGTQDPNGLYLFIYALSSVDPKLWAGTSPDIPAVLEGWEVERVMTLLDSEDKLIRKQTLRTLWRVDEAIVESYYSRTLQRELPMTSEHGSDKLLSCLLEILDIITGDDGESYAHHFMNVLERIDGDEPLNRRPVLQGAVENLLERMHTECSSWRSGCIGVLFATVVGQDRQVSPTLMVVLAALLCEYLSLSPISPTEILRGLASKLSAYSASVQDACLITMLRVSLACDDIPAEALEAVRDRHSHGGRHVKRRCDQFLSLSQHKDELKRIVSATPSSSLPDFVIALENYGAEQQRSASRSPLSSSPSLKLHSPDISSPRASPTPNKLRYAAYEPPKLTHRLRRLSSDSSRHSDDGSARSVGHGRAYEDPMTVTVTAGDLTLAAQTSDLRSISSVCFGAYLSSSWSLTLSYQSSPRSHLSPLPIVQILDEEPSANDLIALDSPFISEPTPSIASTLSVTEHDFEATWNDLESFTSRGWCEASMDTVLRRLPQGLQRHLRVTERDRPPFEGDLKIVICPDNDTATIPSKQGSAVIRLKESDDDSCLWWLRCEDQELRNIIKATLR
ncbi:ARM repeat-containing protein [Trametes meyenii]|nr:ARM repeat-containing protein [Trametes meyenii]